MGGDRRPAVELIAEVQGVTDPFAEAVVIRPRENAVTGVAALGHGSRLSAAPTNASPVRTSIAPPEPGVGTVDIEATGIPFFLHIRARLG
jgi:hypothetical protein